KGCRYSSERVIRKPRWPVSASVMPASTALVAESTFTVATVSSRVANWSRSAAHDSAPSSAITNSAVAMPSTMPGGSRVFNRLSTASPDAATPGDVLEAIHIFLREVAAVSYLAPPVNIGQHADRVKNRLFLQLSRAF